jgi:hypothetical protein
VAATAERAGETVPVPHGEGVLYLLPKRLDEGVFCLGVFCLEGVFYLWGQGRAGERGGV